MSLQLAFVIDSLKQAPKSVVPILTTLHAERENLSVISKVDLKHLTSRTLNLCKAADAYSIWSGVSIVHILVDSVVVLATEGQAFFAQLVKILTSPFANDELILESTVECLNKLCANIRGKPTLTREVLVPNLSGLFSGYMARMEQSPVLMLSSLKTLIEEHPTTSRPFANKLKTKLLGMLSDAGFLNKPAALQDVVCTTLATLPIIEKEGPDVQWRQDVDRLVANLAGTVDIYTNFVNIKDDQEVSGLLKTLAKPEEPEIFDALNIDINRPVSILSISSRMELLLKMLKGYLVSGSHFAVPVPIGRVLAIIELVCSINTKFLPFKGEIRDQEIKDLVELSLAKCYEAALMVLAALPVKYSGLLVPHLSDVFSILESLVFLNNKQLDKVKILKYESMLVQVVACAKNYLQLLSYFPNYSIISRIVDVALFLVQPRSNSQWLQNQGETSKTKLSNSSKAARKKAKKNATIPLADLLSHEHLFENNVSTPTRQTVFAFFTVVLNNTPLPSTQFNKFLKLVIVDAVKFACTHNHGSVPSDVKELLLAASLHPAPESASILPIAASLLPRSEILEVFTNPRFPPLPVMVQPREIEEDEEDEDDVAQEPVRPTKKQKTATREKSTTKTVDSQQASEDIFTAREFKTVAESAEDIAAVKKENMVEGATEESVTADVPENKPETDFSTETFKTPAENAQDIAEVKEANNVEENEDSESEGSELEIPDLDLEDSDEES